jgi:hypothetical protein
MKNPGMRTSILEFDKDLDKICQVLAAGGKNRRELRDKLDQGHEARERA